MKGDFLAPDILKTLPNTRSPRSARRRSAPRNSAIGAGLDAAVNLNLCCHWKFYP